jgi:effector-binding domain-containing protein
MRKVGIRKTVLGTQMRRMLYISGAIALLLVIAAGVGIWMVNNVEQPDYTVERQDGPIEVRRYPPLVVAEVTRTGDRQTAVSAGFSPLADYIFAKDRAGTSISMTAPVTQEREKIAMTAPVTQTRTKDGDSTNWKVHFFMPPNYRLDELPKPGSKDVSLRELPASRRVAIRFSGVASDELIAENESRLREWAGRNGYRATGNPIYAYYNAPFTPGPLRRNEVMLQLEED